MIDFMYKDGITMANFEALANQQSSSSYGSYRKIVGFATELEYNVVEF